MLWLNILFQLLFIFSSLNVIADFKSYKSPTKALPLSKIRDILSLLCPGVYIISPSIPKSFKNSLLCSQDIVTGSVFIGLK